MQAIESVEKYGAQLVVLDVKTKEEIKVISEAKKREMLVFAEVRPQSLMQTSQRCKTIKLRYGKRLKREL